MKHCKTALKRLKEELPGLQVTLLRQRKHFVYELKLNGLVRRLAVSVSPKNHDHTVANAVKEAKQLLGMTK